MTTLQVDKTVASQSLPLSISQLKLDLFSEDQWTHSLELPRGKCTIGSSPSCQIRLTEEQVRPLHCLLVQDTGGVIATSWAPGVLLNSQEFSTAPLYVGDTLTIGNLHLKLAISDPVDSDLQQHAENDLSIELDSDNTLGTSPDPQPHQTDELTEDCEVLETSETSTQEKLPSRESKLAQSNQQARERCRRLLKDLRKQRTLAENLQEEVISHADQRESVEQERDSLAVELEQLRTSSADENRGLVDQLQALQGERDWLSGEVEQLRNDGNEEVRHLTEQLQNLQGERELLAEELEQLHTESSQQIHHLSEQLQVGQAERESLSLELEQRRNSSAELDSQHASELDRLIGELSAAYEKTTQAETALSESEERTQDTLRRIEELAAENEQLSSSTGVIQEEKNHLVQEIAEQDSRISELEQKLRASQKAAEVAEDKLAEQIHDQEELSSELTTLRAELSKAESDNERLKEEAENHQHTISDHQQLLQCSKEELRVSTERLEKESREQTSLRNELAALRTEHEQYSSKKAELINETAEQRKRNELLEIDVKSLTSEWQQALAEITRLKKAEEENLFRIEELEEEQACFDKSAFEALTADRDQLADQLRLLQEDIDVREDLLQNASQRLEQLHAIVSESEEAQAELNEDIAARIGQIELLTGELDELRANVTHQKKERNQFTEKLTDREITIEQLHTEFDALRTNISQVEQERDEIAQRFASQELQYAHLTAELECKRSELECFSEERDQNATSHSGYEDQIKDLACELDSLRTSLSEVEQERDHLGERLACQETQFADLSAELETMRSKDAQIDQEQEEYAQCIAAQVDQIEELTSQLEAVRKSFSLIEQERDHVTKGLAEREATIEQLTAELAQSRDLLTECSEQVQQLDSAYQQSLADLEEARSASPSNPTQVVESLTIKLPAESEESSESAETISTQEDPTEYIESPTVALTTPIDIEEEQAEPPVEFQPPSYIDQYSHLLDENGVGEAEEKAPSTAAPENHASNTLQQIDPLSGGEDGGDDEDLEAYMSNLMRRVRGEMSGDSPTCSVATAVEVQENQFSQNQEAVKKSVPENDSESDAKVSSQPHGLLDMADLKATSSNPTQPIDLASMRELANSSARSAIANHSKRRHFEGVLGKFLVTSIAGGTATAMIASAEHYAHPLFLGGCAVGVVSIYWGFKLLGELLEVIRAGGTDKVPAEFPLPANPLPIDGGNESLEGPSD